MPDSGFASCGLGYPYSSVDFGLPNMEPSLLDKYALVCLDPDVAARQGLPINRHRALRGAPADARIRGYTHPLPPFHCLPHTLHSTAIVFPKETADAVHAVDEARQLLQQAADAAADNDIAEFAVAYCDLETALSEGSLADAHIAIRDLFPLPNPARVAA